ncbi:hypothetical protein CGI23_24195 [Vibrio parahaemolyticus]|uniref:ANR family transcriptional regulator n=1 Tax=Vibrio parahaemolyticus TaxID=670 RepID=UPI00111F9CD9|nr:ANR family transcriptional regulator [Vibrio parahaemolyticus]TOK18357.1 hypothetical protein CGI23_24195 [Vibrio parahaemolyticus]
MAIKANEEYFFFADQAVTCERKKDWLEASRYWVQAENVVQTMSKNKVWAECRAEYCARRSGVYGKVKLPVQND